MSYTTILYIWPGEKIECGEELKNSWGSAPVVWDAIHTWYGESGKYWLSGIDKLWGLYKNSDILQYRRAVFMMTFDSAYVAKEHYKRAARDIGLFLRDWKVDINTVNHWPYIARLFDSEPDIPAIGFWHTSVTENPFEGPWNEELEKHDPPDWSKRYSLYDVLDEIDTIALYGEVKE